MKKYNYPIGGLLIIALASFTFSGCETSNTGMAAPSKNAAHVTIRRAANFGDRYVLNVSIDGASSVPLTMGRSYNGTLTPGHHVISLNVTPNQGSRSSTTKSITVQAGQTYSLTAMWKAQRLVLLWCGVSNDSWRATQTLQVAARTTVAVGRSGTERTGPLILSGISKTSKLIWFPMRCHLVACGYGEPNAVTNAIDYAKHRSRSHRAVIRVYDDAGNVIETHEHAGEFKEP
jgi:hypothetical protein